MYVHEKACIFPLRTFSNAQNRTQRSGAALQWLNIAAQTGKMPSISASTLSICSSVGLLVCGRVQETFLIFLQFSLLMQASSAGSCQSTT